MTQKIYIFRPAWQLVCAGLLFLSSAYRPASFPDQESATPTSVHSPIATSEKTPGSTQTVLPPTDQPATPSPVVTPPPELTPTFTALATTTDDPESPTPVPPSATPTTESTLVMPTTPSSTVTASPSPPATSSMTPAPTPSPLSTTTATPTQMRPTFPPLSVMISEVAWAGTHASAYDEWIELHNPGDRSIKLDGWQLTDGDDILIVLSGTITAYGFFLLERSDDGAVANITADKIYTGGLKNSGECLHLLDPAGALIDSANRNGGSWPAGDAGSRQSMERLGGDDRPGNWATFPGTGGNGLDASGLPIHGTPRQPNAIWFTSEPSPTATTTPSPTKPTSPVTPYPERSIFINEIAWSGTVASSSDEWIELYNATDSAIELHGWKLGDGQDISISLSGSISPGSFFLLERSDDHAVIDIQADQIYTGSLRNSGERLLLSGPLGTTIDTADASGGWPAGDANKRMSMERRGGSDTIANWGTFTGFFGTGHDAGGNPILGTPRNTNSLHFPTPQPTWIPGKIVINEALIRPHYDWQGTGGVNPDDEFIELYNIGPSEVNIRGWILDDLPEAGSAPFELPARTIKPGEFLVFFRSKTHIALNDTGDTVRLLDPAGNLIDSIAYLPVRAANLSYGRLPDGSGHLVYGLWPTPRRPNILFVEVLKDQNDRTRTICQEHSHPAFRVARLIRPAVHQASFRSPAQINCPTIETLIAFNPPPYRPSE